jgi:peptidoglycan/xylan/chitin deacetylase (PgdA/CDA1 family)
MLAILNYHNIAIAPFGMRMPRLYVSPLQFDRHLWWLRRLGLVGVTLSEGIRRLRARNAARCVALTFDDGYADNAVNAAPILAQYGFSATCFVVSERIGSHNTWDADLLGGRKPLMNAAQLKTWIDAGFEVGSHTCTHPDLTTLPRDAVTEELVSSRQALQRLIGVPIVTSGVWSGRATNLRSRRAVAVRLPAMMPWPCRACRSAATRVWRTSC